MSPVLEARNIVKRFGAVTALSDGSLTVERGEIHALLGANGCGKSTLSKVIAGTVAANSGVLRFNGQDIAPKSPRDAEALGIALFYQELSLVPQLTVADNIFLGHEPRNGAGFLDAKQLRDDADALLRRFAGVAGKGFSADAPVSALSPDQRQLVEILKVLARKPKLIIFDESTAALDRRQVSVFFDLVRGLKGDGVSSIFISHRMDEIFAVCDRITVMRNGATVTTLTTAETDRETVVHAMVGALAVPERFAKTSAVAAKPRLVVSHMSSRGLDDVTFDVRPGEILGLGGLQGQGQSAVLRGLFGADPLKGGSVVLDGKSLTLRKPADAIRAGLAYVSGDRGRDAAFHGRSIFENIAAASLVKERRRLVWPSQLKQRFTEAAAALNTKYAGLEAPIGSLSGGNQQKIFISRWLATHSQVLLFDDPTKGIDLAAKADFFALARGLADQGASVIFYASEDNELLSLCDRILVFNSGAITAELTGDTLTAFHLTNAAYGKAA
ncbi:sugar ABC transporter ATP-binding protein [Kaistia sp. 32K]|uniref:sugar ABC transporter ATP-binding protein n=1 Tax=Kaistia sp. 32K TaxID=2795690 RepID=UPI00191687F9|nr:sugar ABC transporter ATP-binding protein [Kaistia sp. 32K]BCP56131.1 sugar ABC transporter ATP-binding protein [Kaistia sp. 32K]